MTRIPALTEVIGSRAANVASQRSTQSQLGRLAPGRRWSAAGGPTCQSLGFAVIARSSRDYLAGLGAGSPAATRGFRADRPGGGANGRPAAINARLRELPNC